MFQKLNKIESPLRQAEEVSYILNGIKAVNNVMKMGKITIKIYHIIMEVDFQATFMHLYKRLTKVRATCGISLVETDPEVKVKNQEHRIAALCRRGYRSVLEHPISK